MLDFIIKNIYLFSAAAMLSIGHFYDERLVIYNINITLIISCHINSSSNNLIDWYLVLIIIIIYFGRFFLLSYNKKDVVPDRVSKLK